jgi:hypothetical protein
MDGIDNIAAVFSAHCSERLRAMHGVQAIVDASETTNDAVATIISEGIAPAVSPEHFRTLAAEISKLTRCLESIDDIKKLAREIFARNFSEQDQLLVFSQEISFSFAAKMSVSMGLQLCHFSNNPTSDEVIQAEIAIAMQRKPVIADRPTKRSTPVAAASSSIAKRRPRPMVARLRSSAELLCNESMPTPTKIRLPLPLQRGTSDRR